MKKLLAVFLFLSAPVGAVDYTLTDPDTCSAFQQSGWSFGPLPWTSLGFTDPGCQADLPFGYAWPTPGGELVQAYSFYCTNDQPNGLKAGERFNIKGCYWSSNSGNTNTLSPEAQSQLDLWYASLGGVQRSMDAFIGGVGGMASELGGGGGGGGGGSLPWSSKVDFSGVNSDITIVGGIGAGLFALLLGFQRIKSFIR